MKYPKKILAVILAMAFIVCSFPLSTLGVFADGVSTLINNISSVKVASLQEEIASGTTEITANAFNDNKELSSITIPKSVTSIGKNAFLGCENLEEINYGGTRADFAKITMADGNDILFGVNINYTYSEPSEGLKFTWQESLSSSRDNYRGYFVSGIGTCTDTEIILPETYKGEKVIGIGQNAFAGNENITGIYVPSGITYIKTRAFADCTNLIWTELHDTINTDDEMAKRGYAIFSGCSSLEFLYTVDMEFVSGTMSGWTDYHPIGFLFGGSSFDDSTACSQRYWSSHTAIMTAVTYYFPNSLKTIQLGSTSYFRMTSPFQGCTTVNKIIIENRISSVPSGIFSAFYGLEEVVLPNSISSIDSYAFSSCSNLAKITIPVSVETIGDGAFKNCSSLKKVSIKEDGVLATISQNVFNGCTSLLSVNFPASIKGVGMSAFAECTSIKKVTIPSVKDWLEISFGDFDANPASHCGKIYIGDELLTDVTVPEGITSIGNYAFYNYSSLQSITMHNKVSNISNYAFFGCSNITSVNIPNSVWSIGIYAFYNCTALTSVTIGSGVTSIGKDAFYNCSNLIKVNISELAAWCKINFGNEYSNPLFYTKKLYINDVVATAISIPSGVTTIKQYAFYNCNNLTKVTISDGVTSIGNCAFYNCSSLASVSIPESVTSIGNNAFYGCNNIFETEDGITYIGSWAMDFDETYTTADIRNGTTKIADGLFKNCTNLISVSLPSTITSIDASLFSGCTSLATVTIPSSVTSIGSSAFSGCSSLINITLPDSITEIGGSAFSGCTALTSIKIPSDVKVLKSNTFSGCTSLVTVSFYSGSVLESIEANVFYNCTALINMEIPSSILSINETFSSCSSTLNFNQYGNAKYLGNSSNKYVYLYKATAIDITSATIYSSTRIIANSAFSGCIALTSVAIPYNVKEMGKNTFYGCTALTSATIGNGVKSIGEYTFYNCTSLTSVTIGSGVTSIGNYAFYNCKCIENITIPDSVKSIGYAAFCNCNGITSVSLGSGLTEIGGSVFSGCSALTSISIPDSVTSIGSNIFYKCTALTSAEIGDGVTKIPDDTFYNCTALTSVSIGSGVQSIGDYAFYYCNKLSKVNITDLAAWCSITYDCYDSYISYTHPLYYGSSLYLNGELLKDVNIPYGVEYISNYAFYDCSSITSVTIPSSVKGIGQKAFYNCYGITTLNIGNGVTAIGENTFYNCRFTSLSIPDSVTDIGKSAFSGCSALTSVTIPDSVTSIGDYAFGNCSKITKVNITDLEAWCKIDFYDYDSNPLYYGKNLYLNNSLVTSLNIPDGIESIGKYAFYNCSSITSVDIPDSVTSIGVDAFYGCSGLENVYIDSVQDWLEITFYNSASNPMCNADNIYVNGVVPTAISIPQSITEIPSYAFYNWSSITSVNIPDTVESIGTYAFYGCINLKTVTMPDNITSINDYTFYNCNKLTSITISDKVTEIGDYAFYNCVGLTEILIPDSVTTIGNYAFAKCSGIKNITVPESVTEFGGSVFSGCTALESADILGGILYIYSNTFNGCSSLVNVTISDTVLTIYSGAFYDCTSLKEIFIPASVVTIESRAFENCSSLERVEFATNSELANFVGNAFSGCNVSSITMGEGGLYYHTSGNCLIETSTRKLVWGCKTSVIPEDGSVTRIHHNAFDGCEGLESIIIPEGIINIEGYAFKNCVNLKTVVLPASLKSMGSYDGYYNDYDVFIGCSGYKIYYCGTQTQWRSVSNYSDYTISGYNYCVHNYGDWVERVEPTCTAKGNYGYYQCSKCSKYFDADKKELSTVVIPALGHRKWVYGSYEPENPVEYVNDKRYPYSYSNGRYTSTVDKYPESSSFAIKAKYDCTMVIKCNLEAEYDSYTWDSLIRIYNSEYNYYVNYGAETTDYSDKTFTINIEAGDEWCILFYTSYYDSYYPCNGWFEIVSCVGTATGYHYESTNNFSATCTESVVCDVCDTVVEQAGHKYSYRSATSATCTSTGRQAYYYCTACYKYFNTNYEEVTYASLTIPAKGHNYGEWIEAVEKTCTTNGQLGHYKCSNCSSYFDENKNKISSVVISASHNVGEWHNAVAATCEEFGMLGYYECADCGNYLDSNKNILQTIIVPPNGHSQKNYDISNPTTYPFALNDGVYSSTNKSHNSSSTFTVTALKDFDLELQYYTSSENGCDKLTITHNSTVLVTASGYSSTITWKSLTVNMKAGDKLYIKYSKDYSVSSGKDTAYFKFLTKNAGIDELEPTCEEGIICDVCGKTAKPAKGHTYGEWIAPVAHTCETDGVLGHYECSDCGKYFDSEKNEITSLVDPAAHDISSWNYPVAATCEETGTVGYYECLGCGKYYNYNREEISTITVSALGHDHSVWVTEVMPTCTKSGRKYSKCIRCEDLQKGTLSALGHNISDGACTLCGMETEVVESAHNYGNSVDEEYVITKENAITLSLTFSSDTATEEDFDIISIYDGNNVLLGEYSGTELASKTITVAGDTVKIVLTSDSSVNAYGFKADIVAVYAECQHSDTEWNIDTEPSIGVAGHKSRYCNDCGNIVGEADILCLSYGDTNHDGTVNALDMAEMRSCMISDTATDDSFDVNGDSVVDARDLVRLKKYLAGMDVPLGNQGTAEAQTVQLLSETAYIDPENQIL